MTNDFTDALQRPKIPFIMMWCNLAESSDSTKSHLLMDGRYTVANSHIMKLDWKAFPALLLSRLA